MISIDDVFQENENHEYVPKESIEDNSYKDIWVDKGMFSCITPGYSIIYNAGIKKFIPGNTLTNKNNAFMGWLIKYDDMTDMVDVLYRGFLFNEPLKMPITL